MNRKQFRERIEYWRLILLPGWRLDVATDVVHLEVEELARVATDEHYLHAEVAFAKAARRRPAAEVDATIVHELLHCLTREYRRTFDLLTDHVSADMLALLNACHVAAEEQLVDRLSRVIAR